MKRTRCVGYRRSSCSLAGSLCGILGVVLALALRVDDGVGEYISAGMMTSEPGSSAAKELPVPDCGREEGGWR